MCFIDSNDFDVQYSVFQDTDRRARATHRCCVCNALIRRGEIYTAHFSVCDGDPTYTKVCALCQQARDYFQDEHNILLPPDSFVDFLVQCYEGADRDDHEARPWREAHARIRWRWRKSPRRSPKAWAA